MSLRARLILLVLIPSIPLLGLAYLLTDRTREMLVQHSTDEIRSMARLAASEIRTAAEIGEHLVALLAQTPGVAEGDRATCRRVFNGVLGPAQHYASFYVTDAQGNVLCHSSLLTESHNFSDRDYFRLARDSGRFVIGRAVIGRVTGRPILPLAFPMKHPDGTFRGLAFAGIDLRWLGDRFAATSSEHGYTITAWDQDGTILYRHPDTDNWAGKRVDEAGIATAVIGRTLMDSTVEATSVEGKPSLYAIVGMEGWSGTRMAISVGLEKEKLFAEADRYFTRGLAVMLSLLAAAFVAAFALGERSIRRRAVALERAAGRIGSGDLEARSGLHARSDELGRLAGSFDRMADHLQREARHLKTLSEANKAVVRATTEEALLAELTRAVVVHGSYCACWVGYARDDAARTIEPMAAVGVSSEFLASMPLTWAESELGTSAAAGAAIRSRSPVVVADMSRHASPWREYAQSQGWASLAALPLLDGDRALGVIVIAAGRPERFTPQDMDLLAQLAAELVFGIRALRNRLQVERHASELEAIVASRTSDLAGANRFLDSVFENIPHMIFVKDAEELRFVRLNRAGEALLGYSRQELIGRSDYDLFPPEEADAFVAADRRLLASEGILDIEEEPIMTRGHGVRLLHTKKFAVLDEAGRPRFLVGISEDITERKGREREIAALYTALEQRAAELQAANRELEAFSYSVSHDLRAPLHAVGGFADALREDYAGLLDERGHHYLDRIRAGAARMEMLIDDLLSLSRISKADLVKRDVDLSALAADIWADLRQHEPARDARITIQPGLRADGDENLLRIALTNLFANAWKFSRGRDQILIEFREAGRDGAFVEYSVKDNGVGFEPAHASRLFGAFQRLHSQSEFPGTGIGLAIVRRAIERHGGRVRAASSPGAGATFYFSLPMEPQPRRGERRAGPGRP